jgi:hypothetical protein
MTDETSADNNAREDVFLSALRENHKVAKCTECKCLQGGLAQLKADYPELEEDIKELATTKFHKQPSCKPCIPGNAWTRYSLAE